MFEIRDAALPSELGLSLELAGAIASFVGVVRGVNDGRAVIALEYEAHTPLAVKEGERILDEARSKFEIVDAACVHRVGRLDVGEVAIRVEASAGHRKAAFAACAYIVDEVKARVPIWKKEHYADGDSGWIQCVA